MQGDAIRPQPAPWVIICGGFHSHGGMDRANFELAQALLRRGSAIHLVSHEVDSELAAHPCVQLHIVPRPFGSILLGERSLRNTGLRIAAKVRGQYPDARVVVNGGNCDYPDINWVHSVHHAWPRFDDAAPWWFRAKSTINKAKARHDEERALRDAKLVIANSERTRQDLLAMGIDESRIKVLYLGSDPAWIPADQPLRLRARTSFEIPKEVTVACFVGALGCDRNKGFDRVLEATQLCRDKNLHILAAGGGRGLSTWRDRIRALKLDARVHLIGFTRQIDEAYAASDLLLSPVRYEAFGLNVLEAICRGLPSIVTKNAGVAELYPPELQPYLLPPDANGETLAALLQRTVANLDEARRSFAPLAARLRTRTWQAMAEEFITLAESQASVTSRVTH